MYNFCNFVVEVKGDNGSVLLNLYDGTYVSLSIEETKELYKFMAGEIKSSNIDAVNNLLKGSWIETSDFRYVMSEPNSHDHQLYDGMISNFTLSTVIVEMSTICSLNCSFCDAEKNTINASCFCKRWNYKSQDFDYRKLIKQLNDFKVKDIYIMGGDPFCNELEFNRMLDFMIQVRIINKNIRIGILVNGYSIKEEHINKLKQISNVYFNILFVGTSTEEYMRITGIENAFNTVVSNVEIIKNHGFPVMATLLVSNMNKVNKQLEIGIPVNVKYLFDENNNDVELLKDFCERLMKIDYVSYQFAKRVNSCLYGKIFIASNQKVYPCPGLRAFELGDLHNESLSEILHKGDFINFWYLSKSKITPCKQCKYRIQCFDCRALEYSKMGSIDGEYYCKEIDVLDKKG